MRSASSRTKNESALSSVKCSWPLCIVSHIRPGVATMTAGFLFKSRSCFSFDIPPTTGHTSIFVYTATARIMAQTWSANSRVGATMSARSTSGNCSESSSSFVAYPSGKPIPWESKRCKIGNANAKVFPLPVCAAPMISHRPFVAGSKHSR